MREGKRGISGKEKSRLLLLQKPGPEKGRTTPLYFAPLKPPAFCLSDFGQTIYIYAGNFYISSERKIWQKMKKAKSNPDFLRI